MKQLSDDFGTKVIQEITTWQIEKYKARRKEEIKRPGAVLGSFKETKRDGTEREVWYVE